MTFDELKNGMKSLFSSLGAKTSDSNYAVGLFDKTSAEPKGIMDMASLASVLGGGYFNSTFSKWESTTLDGNGSTSFTIRGSSVLIAKTNSHSHLYMYGCLYNRVEEIYKGELDNYGLIISCTGDATVTITNRASSSKKISWILL